MENPDDYETYTPFSLYSPYLTTGQYCDIPTETMGASSVDYLRCDERYLSPWAGKMLDDAVMLGLLRRELEILFHESTIDMVRLDRSGFTDKWRSWNGAGRGMSSFNEEHATLHPNYFEPQRMPREEVKFYFNKHFAIYFQRTEGTARDHLWHTGVPSERVGRYFVHSRFYKGSPEVRATDLPYALTFHKSLCDSVAGREDDVQLHGFRLLPLFRAIFMVVDGPAPDEDEEHELWRLADYAIEPPPEWGRRDKWGRDPQDERDIDWYASRHRVLLVRTGDDSHLSAPVSFWPLFASHRALPLRREDCDGLGEDVVRVRLDHALEFVEGLIRREEEALPRAREDAEALERELEELCEQWIGRMLEHAAQVGLDANGFTWHASRRARARLNGEAFDVEQILPTRELVSKWYMGGPS
ncbi:hypothetical protein F5144DRAFT_609903 [Chaetomium tenue]|uniref:Uncharacterized protein n=1 Tax=Chaetomium tenue TaxID=1854479 RepID=A0ACB7PGU3_9PEZI|nr:hypothetical protein F5144DRAFT_609903 [Chaetomium globosum]